MSNWVISVNIKQLVMKEKKKKDSLRDAAFQHQETVRKPWTKKWDILLVPELTYVAMLTVIMKYQNMGVVPALPAPPVCLSSALHWEDLLGGEAKGWVTHGSIASSLMPSACTASPP